MVGRHSIERASSTVVNAFDTHTVSEVLSAPLFGIFDARKISWVSQNPLPWSQEEARGPISFAETSRC